MDARTLEVRDQVALDLEAAFLTVEDKVIGLLEQAGREGWAPEKLVDEVDGLFGPSPP